MDVNKILAVIFGLFCPLRKMSGSLTSQTSTSSLLGDGQLANFMVMLRNGGLNQCCSNCSSGGSAHVSLRRNVSDFYQISVHHHK